MKVITLVNEKGGVGKTTLATHLASGLAARGKRVMLIDTDPQGHATIRMGLSKFPAVYDLFVRNVPFKELAVGIKPERFGFVGETLPKGKLWVVPSNVESRTIASNMQDTWTVFVKLQEIQNAVDVVIFDTSPTPSLLHGAIYLACDALLLPTMLTYSSFDGLVETIKHLQNGSKVRVTNGMNPLEIMGIVPLMYEGNTNEHKDNLQSLHNQFGNKAWDVVPKRILWQETESSALPVWSLEPNSKAAADAYNLLDQFDSWLVAQR
jgi:chromosome partitioning protein